MRKLFFGDTDFAKPRLILFWHSPLVLGSPAGGVWGGMRASKKETGLNHCLSHFSAMYCPSLKGMHPRHPPRAFPLWLLAPRCLCAGYHPRFLGRGSLLSLGRAIYSSFLVVRPRHTHSTLFILACIFCFAIYIFHFDYPRRSSFSHWTLIAEMPEAQMQLRLTQSA